MKVRLKIKDFTFTLEKDNNSQYSRIWKKIEAKGELFQQLEVEEVEDWFDDYDEDEGYEDLDEFINVILEKYDDLSEDN